MKERLVEHRDPAERGADRIGKGGDRQEMNHQRRHDHPKELAGKTFRVVAIGQHNGRAARLHAAQDRQRQGEQADDKHQDGGQGGKHWNLKASEGQHDASRAGGPMRPLTGEA